MKKTTLKNRFRNAYQAFSADEPFSGGQLAVTENNALLSQDENQTSNGASRLWTITRYVLFYAPGVFLLYFSILVTAALLPLVEWNFLEITPAFFWFAFGAFLMMFGIGKISDLKYLKAVAAVCAGSLLIAVSMFLVNGFRPDYLLRDTIYFLPLLWLAGFLVKKRIDRQDFR